MKENKKNVIIGVTIGVAVILFLVLGTLAISGVFRQFDGAGYVSAILKQTLCGDVKYATEMMDGVTEEELTAQYEAGVSSFMNIIISGEAELEPDLEERYLAVCKNILAASKYDVQEAKKISDKEIEVPVIYQPSNVLQLFKEAEANEINVMNEKKENGEYRGSLEEVQTQMQTEYLTACCTLLEEAYNQMEFGEEQTVVLKVVKGEDGLYKLEESAITQFLLKILSLDEKED